MKSTNKVLRPFCASQKKSFTEVKPLKINDVFCIKSNASQTESYKTVIHFNVLYEFK
jgi:hypothetical protein